MVNTYEIRNESLQNIENMVNKKMDTSGPMKIIYSLQPTHAQNHENSSLLRWLQRN